MASQTAPPAPARPAAPDKRDGFIEEQIRHTGAKVKMVEFVSTLMLLGTGILAYLLMVAVIDHWVLSLGSLGRWLALLLLLGAVGLVFYRRLLPLLLHRINPAYSARKIERSYPSLKNSLINFLLLRRDQVAHESIYDVIEETAARDLTQHSADGAVDRLPLIKLGYVFAGVFAAFAIYAVASPKSSFQSMQRVLMPWAAIDRPAKFAINAVEPGDITTFQGATVNVSATVDGPEDLDVMLVYRTEDGQVVDRRVPMKFESGVGFQCTLPEDGTSDGLQRSLSYRIAVGDLLSPEYHITVEPAPTILVERLELNFPAYTKRDSRTISGRGDISALEGTRVIVHGKANFPIAAAHLDLNPKDGATARMLPMKTDGQHAEREILLKLKADGRTPEYKNYRLRFATKDGHRSENHILHQIDVTRDLPPEVEILTPQEDDIQLRETAEQVIEIRALDPDFATQKVILRAISGNTDELNKVLVNEAREGQVVASFAFVPKKLGLKAGDRVLYRAIAEDNRTAVDGSPRPNVRRTRNYAITVVADPFSKNKKDDASANQETPDRGDSLTRNADSTPSQNATRRPQQPPNQSPNKKTDPQNANQPKNPNKDQQDPNQPKSQEQQEGSSKPKPQDGKNRQGKKDDQQQGGAGGGQGSEQKTEGQQNSGKPTGDGSSQNDRETGNQDSGKGTSASEGQDSKGQQNPDGSPRTDGGSGQAGDSTGQQGQPGQTSESNGGKDVADNEDADVFERVLKRMREEREKQDQAQNSGGKKGDQQNQTGEDATGSQGAKKDGAGDQGAKKDGAGDQGAKKDGAGDQGAKKDGAGDQGAKKDGAGDQGAKKDGAGDQGAKKDGAGDQGAKKDGAGDQGAKKDGAGDQGAKKDGAGDQGAKKDGAGDQGAKKDGAGDQGAKKDGAGDQGAKKDGAGDQGAKKDGAGDQGAKKDGAGDQGAKKDGAGDQGAKKDGAGDQGAKKDGAGDQGAKKDGAGDQGDKKGGDSGKKKGGDQSSGGKGQDQQKKSGQQPDNQGGEQSTQGNDKKDSSAKSASNGDRSGDGDKGSGQKGNRQGNDTAGSSSPADQGANSSPEPGKGEDGKKGGEKKKADGKTGKQGNEKGEGSKSRSTKDRSSNNQPGGNQKGKSPEGDASKRPNSQDAKQSGSQDTDGGGIPSNTPLDELGLPKEIPDTENARLEYAKLATAKVLEYLKHNQDNGEVLKDFDLSRNDVQRMLDHYDKLRTSDPQGQGRLADELKSLGLRPSQTRDVRRTKIKRDARGGLRDDGGALRLPKGLIDSDAFDAFIRGAARGDKKK